MRRQLLLTGSAALVVGVVLVLAPVPAFAAESPGPGYVQGVSIAAMAASDAIPTVAQKYATTGWQLQSAASSGLKSAINFYEPNGVAGSTATEFRTHVATLLEPVRGGPATGSQVGRVQIPISIVSEVDSRSQSVAPTSYGYAGIPYGVPQYYYCSANEWALPAEISKITGDGSGAIIPALKVTRFQIASNAPKAGTTCSYLHRIEFGVAYSRDGSTSSTLWKDNFVWTASQFRAGTKSALGDSQTYLCNAPNADLIYANCKWITRDVDGANFDQACSGAPQAEWLSFNWIGPFIGHYARCLFVPLNGMTPERHYEMFDAVDASAIFPATNAITHAVEAFAMAGSCGDLVNGDAGLLGTVRISTCDWLEWSPPVRDALAIFVSVLFGWWGLTLVFRMFSGLFNRKLVSPVDEAAE